MSALRQRVAVSAMRAEDDIMLSEMSTDAARNRFFADVGVTRAEHESSLMTACQFFFRLPDDLHRAVEAKQLVVGYWSLVIGHWKNFADRKRELIHLLVLQGR